MGPALLPHQPLFMFFISSDPAGLTESLPQEPAGSRAQRRSESQPRQVLGTTGRLGGHCYNRGRSKTRLCLFGPCCIPTFSWLVLHMEKVKTLLPLRPGVEAEPQGLVSAGPSLLSHLRHHSGIMPNPGHFSLLAGQQSLCQIWGTAASQAVLALLQMQLSESALPWETMNSSWILQPEKRFPNTTPHQVQWGACSDKPL